MLAATDTRPVREMISGNYKPSYRRLLSTMSLQVGSMNVSAARSLRVFRLETSCWCLAVPLGSLMVDGKGNRLETLNRDPENTVDTWWEHT